MNQAIQDSKSKRNKSILNFIGSFIVALALAFFLKEPAFTDSQVYIIFLLFFAIGLWFTEAIPAFSVSLLIIAFLVFALGNEHINSAPENIDKYVQTFSSSVIWLLLGGFFLATAMTKTKLDQAVFKYALRLSGTNPRHLLIGLMSTTMIISMLMSNTATTAMVIAAVFPLIKSMGKDSGLSKALLLGIPMAASTGGVATIIGTPPNAIAVGALRNAGITIDFLEWMKYGVPLALLLTAAGCFTLIRLYVKDTTPISLDFLENQKVDDTKESKIQRTLVSVVILLTIALWLTTSLHGLTVASICALPLVVLTLTGVLEGKDIQSLPWDTLLLVAGGLSLGIALEHTGLLNYYGQRLISMNINPMVMLFVFGFLTMFISNIMSNTAGSTIMIPLGMAILVGLKMEVALIIAFSASTALFLPVSTPGVAIVYSTGLIDQKELRVGGILIGLLGPLLAVLLVLLLN